MTRKPRIYLAVPYSHHNPTWREFRVLAANLAAAALMRAGFVVFSPISHSHPISECLHDGQLLSFWLEQDTPFLQICDATVVLTLPGYSKSEGMAAERQLSHTIAYLSLEEVYNENFAELRQILTASNDASI